MRVARLAVALLLLCAGCGPTVPPAAFSGVVYALDDETRALMTGRSWRPGCPVGLSDLRLVVVTHWGFDGRRHQGELVVHRDVAGAVVEAFARLHDARFPVERMRLVDHYGGSDEASMADNNTSAFNCRSITGRPGTWSQHAFGRAIDINPVQNPYVAGSTVLPAAGAPHARVRDPAVRGLITAGGPVVSAFAAVGWEWGGAWTSPVDYQHLEEIPGAATVDTTRVRAAPAGAPNADGRVEVAFVDAARGLAHLWQGCATCGWEGPVPYGIGPVEGTPALVANVDGRLEVFAVEPDGTIGHAWQQCAGCGWSAWHGLVGGAARAGGVAAALDASGAVVVASIADDGTVRVLRQAAPGGGWGPSRSIGGPDLVGAPAMARNADGRLELFATAADGWLWHAWEQQPGGPWSGWAPFAVGALGSPSLAVNADGRLEVAVVGTDRTLARSWQQSPGGAWSPLVPVGGPPWRGDPALVANADGRLEVVIAGDGVSGDGSTLWHAWQESPGGGWSGWHPLGGALP